MVEKRVQGELTFSKEHDYLPSAGNSSGTWPRGYVYLSGAVISWIDLDPWGGETGRSSNQAFQPHRYTTYERDANGGDDAMMRRYQSSSSRFSQPDPYDGSYNLSDPQSFNRYAYVQNDPVNFVDPSGLNPVSPDTTFGGGTVWTMWYGSRNNGWSMVRQWFEPHPGSGDPAPTSTPTRTPFENKLNDCTQRLFGVELRSFIPSRRGRNGSFTGYGADALSSRGSDSEITIVNEVNAYSNADIRRITGQDWIGVAFGSGNESRGFTPYRNFTANDLRNSRAILATQIHELGNSLQFITGVTMAPNPNPGLGRDTDPGTRLERCVFGGEYDANGRLHMPRLKTMFVAAFLTVVTSAGATTLWLIRHGSPREVMKSEKIPNSQKTPNDWEITFTDKMGGKGMTSDGAPFSSHVYESSDGIELSITRENRNTPAKAKRALERRLTKARRIIERGSKLDEKGQRIGERVVASFRLRDSSKEQAAVLWTNGQQFYHIESLSLKHVLEFEKQFYH